MTEPVPTVFEVRPRKVRWAAWGGAVVSVVFFVAIGLVLRGQDTGVYFRTVDQVAMVMLGLLLAGGLLLLARPRVRADADGVEVRNTATTHRLAWSDVVAVSFPDGSSWGRLDLPEEEYVPMLAIQAVDGAHAVAAVRTLRAMHAAAGRP